MDMHLLPKTWSDGSRLSNTAVSTAVAVNVYYLRQWRRQCFCYGPFIGWFVCVEDNSTSWRLICTKFSALMYFEPRPDQLDIKDLCRIQGFQGSRFFMPVSPFRTFLVIKATKLGLLLHYWGLYLGIYHMPATEWGGIPCNKNTFGTTYVQSCHLT